MSENDVGRLLFFAALTLACFFFAPKILHFTFDYWSFMLGAALGATGYVVLFGKRT